MKTLLGDMSIQASKESKNVLQEPYDFSLVLGGPLYQLLRRSHLADDALDLARRRVFVITAFVWLPLLIFSVLQGLAWSGTKLPFLYDFDSHCRFLVALPLLIYAELVVHSRMRNILRQFLDRDLVPQTQRDRFFEIVQSAARLRNSIVVEILLIAFVYLIGVNYIWRNYISVQGETWYSSTVTGGGTSFAKLWYVYVSLPFFQFILLRWYFRMFVWTRFLWQVSRLDLQLLPTHPDLSGGLGFLAATVYAFIPLLLAHGVLFSGSIANWIFYEGGKLPQYKLEILAVVAVALFFVLGPLLVFAGHLSSARRKGLAEYGAFAQRYVREFDNKWLRGGAPDGEALIGSADIQSLADLNNSFDVIRSMHIVPFTKETIFQLAVITLLPFLPLMLTMISVEELVDRILKSVF
jgi:hypothetical protein